MRISIALPPGPGWTTCGTVVSTQTILDQARPLPDARFVILYGYDGGWTTNLPLADFAAEDALLADLHDGEPLTADHGGPLRAIVPRLYAWKSTSGSGRSSSPPKTAQASGSAQLHNHGDPWTEERFG